MSITVSELREIVLSVWSTQLQIGLLPVEMPPRPPNIITGAIQISGDWSGAVHVECAEDLTRQAAAVMFGVDAEAVDQRDMQDALGEITNMTAGNVKAMMPGDNHISLPSVTDGADYSIKVMDANPIATCAFAYEEQTMLVTVLKKKD